MHFGCCFFRHDATCGGLVQDGKNCEILKGSTRSLFAEKSIWESAQTRHLRMFNRKQLLGYAHHSLNLCCEGVYNNSVLMTRGLEHAIPSEERRTQAPREATLSSAGGPALRQSVSECVQSILTLRNHFCLLVQRQCQRTDVGVASRKANDLLVESHKSVQTSRGSDDPCLGAGLDEG